MSSWIASNIQGARPPPGQFNRQDGPGPTLPSAKRIRLDYAPGGRFNDRGSGNDGPLGPLLSSGQQPGALTDADRLQATQTTKVLTVNTVRFFPSIRVPELSASAKFLTLNKTFMPGDIVFNLRSNERMVAKNYCIGGGTSGSDALLFSVNLATVNYLLMGLQKLVGHMLSFAAERRDVFPNETLNDWKNWILRDFLENNPSEHRENLKCWMEYFRTLMEDQNGIRSGKSIEEFLLMVLSRFAGWGHGMYSGEENPNRTRDNGHVSTRLLLSRNILALPREHIVKKQIKKNVLAEMCWEFVHTFCRPAGVFIGSDRQGGEHLEAPNPSVWAPNDFVGVVQVAGKNITTANFWMFASDPKHTVNGGDELGFGLKFYEAETSVAFELSSNPNTPQPASHTPIYDFYLLTPCIWRCLLTDCKKWTLDHRFSLHFMTFCIANQMSRRFNEQQGDLHAACQARAWQRSLPLEVFLRFKARQLPTIVGSVVPRVEVGAAAGAAAGLDADGVRANASQVNVGSANSAPARNIAGHSMGMGGSANTAGSSSASASAAPVAPAAKPTKTKASRVRLPELNQTEAMNEEP